jgi:hypothetical protein
VENAITPHRLRLHGNGFQVVVIGGARLHLLFKAEAVVGLVLEIEVVRVVLRGINSNYALLGEGNVDVKHTDCEADHERRP